MKKESIEKIKKNFPDYDFSKSVFLDRRTPIKYICPAHGEVEGKPEQLMNGYGCWQCGVLKRASSRRNNRGVFTIEKLKRMYPEYEFGEYNGAVKMMEYTCPIHGKKLGRPNDLLNGHGCPDCGNARKNEDRKLTLEDVRERSISYHGDVWDFSESEEPSGEYSRIHARCRACGNLNYKPVLRLIYGRCDFCHMSQGEHMVMEGLNKLGIEYERQYMFDDCRYKNPLPFDFYLPKLNTVIEFQGEQHYEFVKFFHRKEDNFEVQKEKDTIKRRYCKEHGIREIEIKELSEVEGILAKLN